MSRPSLHIDPLTPERREWAEACVEMARATALGRTRGLPHDVRAEMVSVALLAVVRAAGRFVDRDECPFDAYAWRMAWWTVEHARRDRRRVAVREAPGLEGWDVAVQDDPRDDDLRDALEVLPSRLAALLPREREALERRYGLGGRTRESEAEIAARMGVSRWAVMALVKRAKVKLRRWYGVEDGRASRRSKAG